MANSGNAGSGPVIDIVDFIDRQPIGGFQIKLLLMCAAVLFLDGFDTQAIGLPLGDACARLYERMPVPEANFFGIVVSIQQKAGGNLSETLGNLSRVLRDRKKMKAKIQAMSMEAKASAMIIGSLPICVGGLVYLTSPDYIETLWLTDLGRVMIACCAVWMSLGVFVMKKMINFDF